MYKVEFIRDLVFYSSILQYLEIPFILYQKKVDMMNRLSILFCVAWLCVSVEGSCAGRDNYNQALPVVAFLPVEDRTQNAGLPWNLSQELTEGCSITSKKWANAEVVPQREVAAATAALKGKDLQKQDPAFFKKFKGTDFIVLVELLNHTNKDDKANAITMQARVKVIDLRGGGAQVILNKLVESNQVIGFNQKRVDYTRVGWGAKEYANTPVGLGHAKLCNDIVSRVEAIVNHAIRG